MKRTFIAAAIMILGLAAAAVADIPLSLNYQGVLTDAGGLAVPDGPYSVTFRIYNVSSGGSALWTETNTVQVTKGIFNVVLGTLVSLNLPFDETYWMGISVEGEAELVPRVILAATAYSLNSRGVTGMSNSFPTSGNVGVGTTTPDNELHVHNDKNEKTTIKIENNDTGPLSAERIIFKDENGELVGIMAFDDNHSTNPSYLNIFNNRPGGAIHLISGMQRRLSIANNGNVGVATAAPKEKLEVYGGGLLIGNTSNTNAGTIRWTGSDFQGYNGLTWLSFTDTGSGTLPSGSSGQTLRHDGTEWIATSNLYNDGTDIGIGTTSPDEELHIYGNGAEQIRVESSSSGGYGGVSLKTNDGLYDYLMLAKYASSAGGSIDGISMADMSIINSGTMGGPMMIDVMTANPLYFLTSNLERMRLDADGNLGINTKTPEAKLHVDGNMWDLDNTEGDFKIGDSTHRLKFGVATGGLGAGTAGIRVMGGVETLKLGAGSAEVLKIENTGAVSIGSDSQNGQLKVFRNGVADEVIMSSSNSDGGRVNYYDESHNAYGGFEADANGTGGFLFVRRGAATTGFEINGNFGGTEEPRLSVYGSTRSASFRMDQTGNGSVVLPNDGISGPEILDEPGAASATFNTTVSLTSDPTNLGSQAIVIPASGYVLVIATGQAQCGHVNGSYSYANFGVSDVSTSFPANQDVLLQLPTGAATGTYSFPVTASGLFQVTAGSHTFYFLGENDSTAPFSCLDRQISLIYIPTAYGTIEPTLAGSRRDAADDRTAPPMTEGDVAVQRAASEAANTARLERELAAMREELDAIKREMGNK